MFYINKILSHSLFHGHKSEDPFLVNQQAECCSSTSPAATSRKVAWSFQLFQLHQVQHGSALGCALMYNNIACYCITLVILLRCRFTNVLHYCKIAHNTAQVQVHKCTVTIWQILHHLAVSSYVHLRKLAPRGNLGNYLPNRESVWTGSISLKYLRSIPRNVSHRVHLEFCPEVQ